jgi:hypothetical protein
VKRGAVEPKLMRISHRDLRACLANPREWVKQRQSGAKSFTGRPGYNSYLKYAMRRMDRGDALAAASSYFTEATRKLVNRAKKDERLAWLAGYEQWRRSAGVLEADWFARPLLAVGNVALGGRVDRVDFLQGEVAYRGLLLGEAGPPAGWQEEPVYPLLQFGLAARYGRPANEFGVGFQRLEGGDPEVNVYSRSEMRAAVAVFERLAKRISQYMR